jgi:hypothetical protein
MAKRSAPSEKAIQNEILVDVSSWDETLVFRNNTGMAWQGERLKLAPGSTLTVEPGMVVLRNGRPVKFGLEGSADILGSAMGWALAIEVKTDVGRQREQQGKFQTAWQNAGGLYIIARSVADAQRQFFANLFS